MSGPAQLAAVRKWWAGLAQRERRLVGATALLLVLVLLWLVAIAPAWRTVRQAPAQIDAAEAQLQAMQRQAAEAGELRAAPPVNLEQANAALRAATARLGDKGKLAMQGERAVLTVNMVGSGALRDWLAEVRQGARARPVEVSLTRGASGLSGTVTVAVGGAP
jgi:general secretion pathway protein M